MNFRAQLRGIVVNIVKTVGEFFSFLEVHIADLQEEIHGPSPTSCSFFGNPEPMGSRTNSKRNDYPT
jgi:hypothetical protein